MANKIDRTGKTVEFDNYDQCKRKREKKEAKVKKIKIRNVIKKDLT